MEEIQQSLDVILQSVDSIDHVRQLAETGQIKNLLQMLVFAVGFHSGLKICDNMHKLERQVENA